MSGLERTLEPTREVRRVEVITGAGGRRRWMAADKARIVAETLEPGAVVSVIARRHGLTPQQLFAWRRAARSRRATGRIAPAFVPAVVGAEPARRQVRLAAPAAAAIELEIDGVAVRIGDGANATTIAAVIRALKGAA